MICRSQSRGMVCLIWCVMLVVLIICDLGVGVAYLGNVVSKEMS